MVKRIVAFLICLIVAASFLTVNASFNAFANDSEETQENTKNADGKRTLKIAAGCAGLVLVAGLCTFLIVRKKPLEGN